MSLHGAIVGVGVVFYVAAELAVFVGMVAIAMWIIERVT